VKQLRGRAAQALLNQMPPQGNDVHDLLNFFERLGYLLREGALDADTAWSFLRLGVALPQGGRLLHYSRPGREARGE
jgi:hypothetical protein